MDATVIQSILDAALGQGIWCGLFVYLFWDSRRRNETREKELMQIISKYGDNFKEITDILSKMKDEISGVKIDLEVIKNTQNYSHYQGGESHEN